MTSQAQEVPFSVCCAYILFSILYHRFTHFLCFGFLLVHSVRFWPLHGMLGEMGAELCCLGKGCYSHHLELSSRSLNSRGYGLAHPPHPCLVVLVVHSPP